MTSPSARRRLLALLFGLVAAIGLAEGGLRLFVGPVRPLGRPYFRDADGEPIDVNGALEEALRRHIVELLPPDQTPRPRGRFAPGAHFFMCYEDVARLDADWLDPRGCVEVRINRFGLREREELTPDNKGPDERRVLCIGDSFTFGWGVPIERCWVRLLEGELRQTEGNVRTINCGASGALTVDEYWWGLRGRFGVFRPDAVLVSIYLNDLIPSNGLCVMGPQPQATGFQLFDRLRMAWTRDPLDLAPGTDWTGILLGLSEADAVANSLCDPDKPYSAMWSQGAPQAALTAMQAWAKEHNSVLLVVLWPFLQGLGPGAHYPFEPLHELVGAFCKGIGIPFLDLRPALDVVPARQLWVTPFDLHANPRAHRLALPAITSFVRDHLRR